MTQIRKAFECAVKNAALRNFRTIFRKALNETAEKNISSELSTLSFPELSSNTIPSLQPETQLRLFANSVDKTVEQMFHAACRQAKFQTLNVSLGEICARTLERMNDEDFRTVENEVISDFLNERGAPASIIVTMVHILEYFFAKELLTQLIKAREENANEGFDDCVDRLTREAATGAFLAVMEYTPAESAGQYKAHFMPCVLTDLNRIRTQEGDNVVFNNAQKHTFGAFFRS